LKKHNKIIQNYSSTAGANLAAFGSHPPTPQPPDEQQPAAGRSSTCRNPLAADSSGDSDILSNAVTSNVNHVSSDHSSAVCLETISFI